MPTPYILTTQRLGLRQLVPEDASNLYKLNADPEVVKYTGDTAFENTKAALEFLLNYDHYERYDMGRWAVINRASNVFLGWCGIKYTPELNEYDIGYRFMKEYWGLGFATESAKACLDFGFSNLLLTSIVGRVNLENTASIKVLTKIGMIYQKPLDFDGSPGVQYISSLTGIESAF